MKDIEATMERNDIDQIIDKNSEEAAEALKEVIYDAFINVITDILKAL